TPDAFKPGMAHGLFVDQPEIKAARMNVSAVEDGVSIIEFHYLVATAPGVAYFTERHELGLFTLAEYEEAMRAAGLEVMLDHEGLMGRGLLIGRQPGS
ncbi:MAG: type 12 methyltransferase, partial [Armatimonadetes bacterium CSP1-3]